MLAVLMFGALTFCGLSVFSLCKANYCACKRAGQCDNPLNHYWLAAILSALLALACSCLALHTEKGTLVWILMMASCLAGALLSAQWQKRKLKQAGDLLTDGIN
ncbi:hypothetical protein [Pseudoalteromonas rubra]|uniref:DUF3325 domain-containing protein n=1 Tax=Pseudoalteromonas rubra TaxID=43658 RepID=A0A0F4QR22_9GAMM|nr:hypothetical protein [Pseudoalteromonas rubra]KJZ09052.1 hypothetical protein TW77_11160 [Pseudoalteromonas rubra]